VTVRQPVARTVTRRNRLSGRVHPARPPAPDVRPSPVKPRSAGSQALSVAHLPDPQKWTGAEAGPAACRRSASGCRQMESGRRQAAGHPAAALSWPLRPTVRRWPCPGPSEGRLRPGATTRRATKRRVAAQRRKRPLAGPAAGVNGDPADVRRGAGKHPLFRAPVRWRCPRPPCAARPGPHDLTGAADAASARGVRASAPGSWTGDRSRPRGTPGPS
jgi:hypothetical protein